MFALSITLLLLAVGAGVARIAVKPSATGTYGWQDPFRIVAQWTWAVAAALAILCLVLSSLVIVSTKNIGVKTSFGAVDGFLTNGLHVKKPWDQVHEMDGAIQTDSYYHDDCIQVRIANQQTGCVFVSIRWRIRPEAVDELYRDYRSFDHVRDSLVTRELVTALNANLADYNPLNAVGVSEHAPPSNAEIAKAVTEQMRSEIGQRIEVLNTLTPLVKFDPDTQRRINQLQQQVAATRIATQAGKTAEEQSKANNKIAESVRSPNVLVAQCMDALTTMVKNRLPIPAGFSCWPGSGPVGVIANATK